MPIGNCNWSFVTLSTPNGSTGSTTPVSDARVTVLTTNLNVVSWLKATRATAAVASLASGSTVRRPVGLKVNHKGWARRRFDLI